MKALAAAVVVVAALAAPALACPNMDKDEPATPRTADKGKSDKAAAPDNSDTKPADAAKPKPADAKAADKTKDAAKPSDGKKAG